MKKKKRVLLFFATLSLYHKANEEAQTVPCITLRETEEATALCLVRSTPDGAVWVRALAGDIVLCS